MIRCQQLEMAAAADSTDWPYAQRGLLVDLMAKKVPLAKGTKAGTF